jgi:hypothetical protein
VRILLLLFLLLGGCEKPCALVCGSDADCVQQSLLPGYYCVNETACLQDCYRCNGSCVPIHDNCGQCFNACAAVAKCYQGNCITACPSNTTDCSGSCYDTLNDRTNCGHCGTACLHDQTCVNGQCSASVCG